MKIKLKIDLVEDESPHVIIENVVDFKSMSFGKTCKELIIAGVRLVKSIISIKLHK